MPFEIPYTFYAGTKAKAEEVNRNFLAVKQFIDILEQDTAENTVEISDIQANKADLNGNAQIRFQVDDAINGKDAVNKDMVNQLTANVLDYIGGFVLTRVSDTQIRASAGACWDSTHTHMIQSTGNLTLDTNNLAANATYYVYVVDDTTGTNLPQLAYGDNQNTVALPDGYDVYRRLGYFTTDSDADILNVSSESGNASQGIYVINDWHSGKSWARVWSNGFKECGGEAPTGASSVTFPNNIVMSDTNYYCNAMLIGPWTFHACIQNLRTDGFNISTQEHSASRNNCIGPCRWEARGY